MKEDSAFDLEAGDEAPVLRVCGEVDLGNIARFEDALRRAARANAGFVIISLTQARYFDSRTLATLGSFGRNLERNGQVLLLAMPPDGSAARILEISGISQKFRTFATVDEAREFARKAKERPNAQ